MYITVKWSTRNDRNPDHDHDEIMMLLRQLSYTIETQLKAPKAPYYGHFLPFAVSLWQMGGFM